MLMVLSPKTLEPRDMAAYIKVQYSISILGMRVYNIALRRVIHLLCDILLM